MPSATFTKNLALFAKERPVEAFHLQQVDTRGLKRIKPDNLKMPYGTLYAQDPEKEAEEWFNSLELRDAKLLYVYGVGLGLYFKPVKKWLEKDEERHVVFFEDDLALLKRFMEEPLATELLESTQVTVCFVEDAADLNGVLETLYWSFVLTPFHITALHSYAEHKNSKYEEFRAKIAYSTTMKNALLDEYMRYGVAFFRNFYPNILEFHRSQWGNALFDQFKGVPAIICGAGPSLDKQVELLGTLKNRALIFAGGSSLNVVSSQHILPHFGAGIDPNPTQFLRLASNQAYELPFFYRTRLLNDAFRKIRGPLLYISGAGGYDVAEWYEEKFGIKSEDFLDEGHNVVNFCTEVATRLGCNPLIYIGMDLAFTDMKAYSSGITENVQINVDALLEASDEEEKGITRPDVYGKPTLTLWKWIAEADWLGDYAKQHPEIKMINCTEGGIGFPDIPHIPFKEAVKEHLTKSYDLNGRVHGEIQMAALPQVSKQAVDEATTELKASLERCIEHIDLISSELAKEKKNPHADGTLHSGRAALAETELFDEPGYKYVLDIFHQVFARVQNKRIVQVRVNKMNAFDAHTAALEKLAMQTEKLHFIRNVAEANITLINFAFKELANAKK